MPPTYKYTYFNVRARGEVPRYLFELAGVSYQDIQLTFEEWPKVKDTTFSGQLPQLEVDGKYLCQSAAISRYLGREFGMWGKTSFEVAEIDMLMGLADDMNEPIIEYAVREKDEQKKADLKKKLEEQTFPRLLKNFDKALAVNKTGSGWLVGDKVTVADAYVYHTLKSWMLGQFPDALKSFPKLTAFLQKFENLPKIAAYIKRRPDSKF